MAPRTIRVSVSDGSAAVTRRSRLKPLLKWLRRTASATAWREAETQRPRPGSLRLRSATTSPEGVTTKRISSSIGRTSRLTAHIRMVADLLVRGPWSSSGSAMASMRATWLRSSGGGWLIFGACGLLGLLVEVGQRDPAGEDACLHDHGFRVLAGDVVAIENAGMLGLFAAFLAFGPTDQVVGGAAGEVLDGLDVVLAELHQHLRGHARHCLQIVIHAEFLPFVFEFGLELIQIFLGAILQLSRGLVVKAFDAGQFPDIDHRQFLHRGEAFRGKQLADDFVDIEGFH